MNCLLSLPLEELANWSSAAHWPQPPPYTRHSSEEELTRTQSPYSSPYSAMHLRVGGGGMLTCEHISQLTRPAAGHGLDQVSRCSKGLRCAQVAVCTMRLVQIASKHTSKTTGMRQKRPSVVVRLMNGPTGTASPACFSQGLLLLHHRTGSTSMAVLQSCHSERLGG